MACEPILVAQNKVLRWCLVWQALQHGKPLCMYESKLVGYGMHTRIGSGLSWPIKRRVLNPNPVLYENGDHFVLLIDAFDPPNVRHEGKNPLDMCWKAHTKHSLSSTPGRLEGKNAKKHYIDKLHIPNILFGQIADEAFMTYFQALQLTRPVGFSNVWSRLKCLLRR